ncbi:MAG: hypothetical protein O3A27_02365 [Actinomycetota bacterium]|nr:hypothetical protein [Actinomycetota bacterium]
MESLAKLVMLMVLASLLSGPIAIALTLIKRKSTNLTHIVLRRLLQSIFLCLSLFFGLLFLFNQEMPPVIHAIGFYALVMSYIAIRREYFPTLRIVALLRAKFGMKPHSATNGDKTSLFGPVMKWRRNSHSGGKDGQGPAGQD